MRAIDRGTVLTLGTVVCAVLLMALAWSAYRDPALGVRLDVFRLCG